MTDIEELIKQIVKLTRQRDILMGNCEMNCGSCGCSIPFDEEEFKACSPDRCPLFEETVW